MKKGLNVEKNDAFRVLLWKNRKSLTNVSFILVDIIENEVGPAMEWHGLK